jgi:MFS family permease
VHELPLLWRHRDFRWLFVSQSISTTGDRLVLVALALLVTERTGSTVDLGIVFAAHAVALVSFLLLGGVWADRLPRHKVMLATDLVRGALHTLLAVLIFTDTLTIWQLVAIEACFGAAEAFFRPAYAGLVPQTVPEELIQQANALNGFSQTVAEFAGPALATTIVLTLGTGAAFAIDAGTFAVSALLLTAVCPRPRGEPAARTTMLASLREGWHEVRSRSWVWVTIAVFSFHLVVGFAPYVVLGPTIADEVYGSPETFGWLAASIGLGTASGALFAFRWRPRRPLVLGILFTIPFSGMLAAFALGLPLAAVLPIAIVSGLGLALFDVWWETALAQRVPPGALSRVASYDWMGSWALLPVGYILIGLLAEHVDPAGVMAVCGALGGAALLVALIPRETRQLGQLAAVPEPPPLHSGLTPGTSSDMIR